MHLIHQVFDGIQYLHTNGMIHRDLKPENLLMVGRDPGTEEYMMLKIADFGLSAQRSAAKSDQDWEKTLQEFCGTQDYLAPEVFTLAAKRNKGHVHYTGKVDVWAAGVIYYIMLCGYPPFWPEDDEVVNMIKQITAGKYGFHSPAWDPVSEVSKSLIRQCLTVDAESRPTSIDIMSYPIFAADALPSDTHLGVMDELSKYKARFKEHAAIKSVKAMMRMEKMAGSQKFKLDDDDPQQREAASIFATIDAKGDRNGQLELFEIILYMQEYWEHAFSHKDVDGRNVVDEDKLKNFCVFLRDALDKNNDGLISKEEFVRGYCIWKMHLGKFEQESQKRRAAADLQVY